ncbi:MAG: alcohol dehydrogenase catalytic domain-containing protein [Armatimonadetes bacterium]|nr:alcohol dehydrogenase catalytic domain-containing protein [Armatimonadota bacterium]
MWSARLHGPRDMRVEQVDKPGTPEPGEVLLRTTVTSVCGSDLHWYTEGGIGDLKAKSLLVLGHEFAGVLEEVGSEARDGLDQPLTAGQRVAVDPAMPCHRCEFCEEGHPNLCRRLHFCGTWPDDGSLSEYMVMPARTCFPLPDSINDTEGALLEPLGIGIHAVRLAGVGVGESVAVLGSGPIGLMIMKLAQLSGAAPIIATDLLPWRLEYARRYGATVTVDANENPIPAVMAATDGRGVDVIFEAAFGDETVAQAAEMARLGGRLVLVGITNKDNIVMRASAARRKGLTIKMSRRMKHTYPTALRLAVQKRIDLMEMVTHRFPLREADKAFALNADYTEGVVKAVIETPNP